MATQRAAPLPKTESYLTSPEYAFVSTMLWINRFAYRIFDRHGLIGAHVHAMARVDEQPGLVLRELAERMHRDIPATSRIVQKLVEMGLLERRDDVSDRRRKPLHLTKKGARIHTEVQATLFRERASAGIELDPNDVAALWRVAKAMQDGLRKYLQESDEQP